MSEKKKPFNEGLAGLAKVKQQIAKDEHDKERAKEAALAAAKERNKPRTSERTDEEEFLRAMSGVKRITPDGKGEVVRKPAVEAQAARNADDEVEALVDLASAIDHDGTLEAGAESAFLSRGLDVRIVKHLLRGGFPIDAQIDLHGLTRVEAEKKVEHFVKQSRVQKLRCVLVITGRGAHSELGPVLKDAVHTVLTRGQLVKHVLAIAPATKQHGGEGAFYVLLRRR